MGAITYTTAASDPELDAGYERALAAARDGTGSPLPHLVAGEPRHDGVVFERRDPCEPSRVVSSAHAASAAVVADAVAAARAAQREWGARPVASAPRRCAPSPPGSSSAWWRWRGSSRPRPARTAARRCPRSGRAST